MKYILLSLGWILSATIACSAGAAGSCQMSYKVQPGQIWVSEVTSQFKSTAAEAEAMPPTRFSVRYRILKGDRRGWVKVEAKFIAHSAQVEGGPDYTKLTYTADMHRSGELRNVAHTGSAMPPLPKEQMDALPPQYAAMMAQSNDMMAKGLQTGVFWFPELPENQLSVGDSFDDVQKSDLGNSAMMQVQTVVKTEYTLEDVSQGLAYFSVRQRSQSKVSGMGSKMDTRAVGKADAIFDLEQGMWVEMTTKTQTASSFGDAGSGGTGGLQVSRYRMQRQ
ncbi:MAG TPA: hypothetical protein VKA31_03145 [Mariprofundaceae bacterium]|nr:hypothetical protein [Mariprofundaceae bacterium]